jgi:hypothetical protein
MYSFRNAAIEEAGRGLTEGGIAIGCVGQIIAVKSCPLLPRACPRLSLGGARRAVPGLLPGDCRWVNWGPGAGRRQALRSLAGGPSGRV